MKEIIVVGGGLAGLSATLKLAELGLHIKLLSVTKVKRSHSVCAQGGLNAAKNTMGEGDSPAIHAFDTIKGGDYLADQPAPVEMCYAAPLIIDMLDRFGAPFTRTDEGHLAFRRFGGTLYNRTAFCGGSTGQQLLYALDEQVRRHEVEGRVEKYEMHELMRLVCDEEGIARGVVYMDLFNLKLDVFRGDAVVVATGGPGMLFKPSTNSTFCTGAANGRLFMQGMHYANGEFIQIHPSAVPGEDKARLISESVRGEGGRIWVYGDSAKSIETPDGRVIPCGETGKPWYFLEELYPAFGNLVPRDIGARELIRICQLGLGVDGKNQVFLDISEASSAIHHRLESVLEIYEKFTGDDPRKVPMRIFPAVHYSMGGAWVDWPAADDQDRSTRFRQMTNIPGLFNVGESDFAYHGANRLGANSLMSCIFGGLVTGTEVKRYVDSLEKSFHNIPGSCYEREIREEEALKHELLSRNGGENIYKLHEELGALMLQHASVWRNGKDLKMLIQRIKELRERCGKLSLDDRSRYMNQGYIFANQFRAMLEVALVIATGAYAREESRGSHTREDFPERDDQQWLKTTIASYSPEEPLLSYRPVDMRHFPEPQKRDYAKIKKDVPEPQNLPRKMDLPL